MNKAKGITEDHIGSIELTSLIIMATSFKLLLTVPKLASEIGLTGGWLIWIISTVFAVVGYFFVNKLFLRFPSLGLDEINRKVLGSWLGGIANLGIIIFFVFYLIVDLREFSELIISTILPNTPISVILFILMCEVLIGTYMGIEVMTRASMLLYPFLFLGFFLLIILALPHANILNIYPLIGSGVSKITLSSLVSISRFGEIVLIIGLVIPYIRIKKNVGKIGYASTVVFGISCTFSVLTYLMIFEVPIAIKTGIFAMFQVARIVSIGSFLERLESVFVFIWIFTALVSIRTIFYCLNLIIAKQLKLTTYRPLIFPIGVLIYTVSFLPPDFITSVNVETNILRPYGSIPSYIIPIVVLIIAKLRGLKEVE